MTVLLVVPDYASHWYPMSAMGQAWLDAGERVVVATGPVLRPLVDAAGFEWTELRLGSGSNPGVIRAADQPAGEDDHLRRFFAVTTRGPVATLAYQASGRTRDLLWRPADVTRRLAAILARIQPTQIIADHISFGVTLALRALGASWAAFVPGHPAALPGPGEVYGLPPAWPVRIRPPGEELARLRARCDTVAAAFTAKFNDTLERLSPGAEHVADAFAVVPGTVLYNYPAALHDPARRAHPGIFLGSCVRSQPLPPALASRLAGTRRRAPTVYVSFGSFLSVRDDVLTVVVAGLRSLGIRGVVAAGSADPSRWNIPDGWIVAPSLPQVAVLDHVDAVVCHAGNNTVTEALTAGVPVVALPFSTDQFAIAADLERTGLGVAGPPNELTPPEVASLVEAALTTCASPAAALGESLRAQPGPRQARAALNGARPDVP
jgi:zeaxanthin glucosyltransferase